MGALPSYFTYQDELQSFVNDMTYRPNPTKFIDVLQEYHLDNNQCIQFEGKVYNEDFIQIPHRSQIFGKIDVIKQYPDGSIMFGISNGNQRMFIDAHHLVN
jgi:hypothetical protein